MYRFTFGTIATAMVSVALFAITVVPSVEAQLLPTQQKCLNSVNKAAFKVFDAQGKENSNCVKSATKGKLSGTTDACLGADAKGKVQGAKDKVGDTQTKKCLGPADPGFALPGAADAADAAATAQSSLVLDVLGDPADPAIQTAKPGSVCQSNVVKSYDKYADALVKNFLNCKKSGLSDNSVLDAATLGGNCVFAPDDKSLASKASDKLGTLLGKKCQGVDLATAFPGECSSQTATVTDFRDCLLERVNCRVCQAMKSVDDLDVDCDALDNGSADLSCPASQLVIPPGFDCFETPADCNGRSTSIEFGSPEIPPIPADFFGPGSEPFIGEVRLQGAGDPVFPDTVIERLAPIELPQSGPDGRATRA